MKHYELEALSYATAGTSAVLLQAKMLLNINLTEDLHQIVITFLTGCAGAFAVHFINYVIEKLRKKNENHKASN